MLVWDLRGGLPWDVGKVDDADADVEGFDRDSG